MRRGREETVPPAAAAAPHLGGAEHLLLRRHPRVCTGTPVTGASWRHGIAFGGQESACHAGLQPKRGPAVTPAAVARTRCAGCPTPAPVQPYALGATGRLFTINMETHHDFDDVDDPATLDAAVLAALDALDDGGWGYSLGTVYDAQGTEGGSGGNGASQPGRHGEEESRRGTARAAVRPGAPKHAPAGWDDGREVAQHGVGNVHPAGASLVDATPDAAPVNRAATPPGSTHHAAVAPSAGVPLKFFARRGGREEEEDVSGAVSDDDDSSTTAQQQQQHGEPRPSSRAASQRRLAALEAAWAAEAAAQEERLSKVMSRPASRASSDGGAVTATWKAEAARQVAAGISPSAPGSVADEDEHARLVRQTTPQPRPTTASSPLPPPHGQDHPRLRRTPPPRPDSAASSELSSLHEGGSQQGGAQAMSVMRASWQQTRGPVPPGPAEGMLDEDAAENEGRGGTWFGGPAAGELLHRALVTPTAPADVGPKEYTQGDLAVPPTDLVGDLTQVPGVLLEAGTRLVSALREGVDRDLAEQRRAASDAVARLVIALGSGLPLSGADESMDGAALRRRGGSVPVSPQAGSMSPFAQPVQLSGWQEAMLEAVQSMEESLERHHASAAAACRAVESDVLRVSLAMQDTGNSRGDGAGGAADAASQKTLLQRWLETAFGSKAAYDQWLHTVAASLCLTPDARRGCLAVLRSLEPMRRQAINRRKAALVAEVVQEREVTASRGGTPVLFRPTSGATSARSSAADARSGEQPHGQSRPATAMSGGGGEGNGDEGDDTRGILLERLPGLTDEDLERMAEFLGSDVGSVWGDGDDAESILAGETGTGLASSPVPGRPPVDDATYAAAQRVARMVAEARAAAALREQQRAAKGGSASGDAPAQAVAAVRTGEAYSPSQAPASPQSEAAAAAAAAASFFVPSKGSSRASSRTSSHQQQPAAADDSVSVAPPSSGVATAVVGMFTRDTWLQKPQQPAGPVRASAALLGGDATSLAAQRPAPPDRSVAGRPRPVVAAASSAGGSIRQTGRVNISSSDEEDAPLVKKGQAAAAAPHVGDASDGSAGGWGFDKGEMLKRRGVTPLIHPKAPAAAAAPPQGASAKPGGGVLGAVWRTVAGGGGGAAAAGMASDSSAGSAHRAARRAKRAAQLTGGAGPGQRGVRAKKATAGGPQWLAIATLAAQALGTLVVVALIALVLIMVLF